MNELQSDIAHRNGERLRRLINDILDLSKVEAGKLELELNELDLHGLLNRSMSMVKEKSIKHGIKLKTTINGIPEFIRADERKLKQILYNLLSNAVKFTPNGGEVLLSARTIEGIVRPGMSKGDLNQMMVFEHPLDREELEDGGEICQCIELSVSDTGIGIALEEQERIFNAFEQVGSSTNSRYEGTGLGLSLTKNLVELHGGKIWVESEGLNLGSTFRVVIPAHPI